MPDFAPAAHYDRVTEAWNHLLGNELHYGVFDRGDEDLATATAALTNRMVDGARLEPGLRVLDVGCGTGAPACHLAEEFGVEVVGITTSEVGVEQATRRAAERGLSDRVTFELRDGTANGLPDRSFDRVWVLESSHLMPARDALVAECARVLRPGGRMVLCDVMRMRTIPFEELRTRTAEFAVLRAAFGNARMDSMDEYVALAEGNGLEVDVREDLTAATLPTFDRWLANADRYADLATEALGQQGLEEFREGSRVLDGLWREGTLGYGLFAARRP
ncbi:SAM-dependent methyltransferase [Nocardioides sp. SYSU DS0651]|uniref:SAM-dependent methyltransferase n=1 Tax=Nocardioides sp. SYSU DS0651 TaxID=3415955 RepID=UPI003F4C2F57